MNWEGKERPYFPDQIDDAGRPRLFVTIMADCVLEGASLCSSGRAVDVAYFLNNHFPSNSLAPNSIPHTLLHGHYIDMYSF